MGYGYLEYGNVILRFRRINLKILKLNVTLTKFQLI